MDRLEIFKTELNYIKDNDIKIFTEKALLKLPDYFFKVAASSTGKYHPNYSLGEGGLVRHTKVAVRIAVDLMGLEMMNYTDIQKDIVISSLILHDGMKHGLDGGKFTITEHPLLIVGLIKDDAELSSMLDKDILSIILSCISTHMGEWNKDYKTQKEILPKPQDKLQSLVHIADYLSSRKYFAEFDFDIIIPRR